MLFSILLCGWILSIVIWCIMHLNDSFCKLFKEYGYKEKGVGTYSYISSEWKPKTKQICAMAFAGGWIFWPYFIYLAYKYFKIVSEDK